MKRKSHSNSDNDSSIAVEPPVYQSRACKRRAKAISNTVKEKQALAEEELKKIASVHLPGEETCGVPIFATCVNIRDRLGITLAKPGVTQAIFCLAVSEAAHTLVTLAHLYQFRNKDDTPWTAGSEHVDGADNPVFYALWVFFEKERVLKGIGKKYREIEMEKAWGPDGLEPRGLYFRVPNEGYEFYQYGRPVVHGRVKDGRGWRTRKQQAVSGSSIDATSSTR